MSLPVIGAGCAAAVKLTSNRGVARVLGAAIGEDAGAVAPSAGRSATRVSHRVRMRMLAVKVRLARRTAAHLSGLNNTRRRGALRLTAAWLSVTEMSRAGAI